jgi:hypothetical protein
MVCAGSTLLLVQSKALDEAPYKLSGAVAKPADITFWSLAFFWTNKPWFLIEGKFVTLLIIPSSWGSQLGGHPTRIKLIFWRRSRGKRRLPQGKFRTHILYFVLVLLYFIFACIIFIKNTKKLVSFIVVFTCLLLALLEWARMRTPSCVILLALITVILSTLLLCHLLLL